MSWLACAAFVLGVLPALVATTGWLGLVKFWLMPWLGYHFWMSTFTVRTNYVICCTGSHSVDVGAMLVRRCL